MNLPSYGPSYFFLLKAQSRAMKIPQTRNKGSTFFLRCRYVNKWCDLFYVQNTDPLTIRGRSALKDGVVNECIFRNRSFREFKIAKESNDSAKVLTNGLITNISPL